MEGERRTAPYTWLPSRINVYHFYLYRTTNRQFLKISLNNFPIYLLFQTFSQVKLWLQTQTCNVLQFKIYRENRRGVPRKEFEFRSRCCDPWDVGYLPEFSKTLCFDIAKAHIYHKIPMKQPLFFALFTNPFFKKFTGKILPKS